MQPEQLIDNGAQAIRSQKYTGGGARATTRRKMPLTETERRYAAAAQVAILRDLADMQLQLTPEGLRWWALEIEGADG